MQVISDGACDIPLRNHKLQVADATLVLGHYFLPDVVSISDYYPYGMEVAARSFSAGGYRYGFQGQACPER